MAYNAALVETWSLYGGGSLIFLLRIVCRVRTIGFAGFKPDDYIVFLSWATYTVMTVAAHIVGGSGDLHALPLEQRKNLSPEEAATLVYGTQWFCAGVATYILFIWTLKLNMLFLYQRVVNGLWVEKLIKPVMMLVVATFIASYLILFCVCRPYRRMWTVYPDQGEHCQPQSMLNMVPPLVMNVVTDIMILAIPAPVVIPVKTSLGKRLGLLCLFGAGIFIMIAAIIRVTMVLVVKNGATAAIWSCREDFVAIVVGQAILIRPVFRRSFWNGDYGKTTTGYSSKQSKGSGNLVESTELSVRKHRKAKDPYSVTVALATVHSDGQGSTDDIICQSNPQPDPIHTIREHSESSLSPVELEEGTMGHANQLGSPGGEPGSRMVIHVSKELRVDNSYGGSVSRHRTRDSLRATNAANCWNQPEDEHIHYGTQAR